VVSPSARVRRISAWVTITSCPGRIHSSRRGNRVTGRDAITHYFQNEYAGRQTGTISFSDYEVYGGGRVMTEVANLAIYGRDGKLKSRGKQILIFLKQGDRWKLHKDIWNSDPE
jgi:hypothetical protein